MRSKHVSLFKGLSDAFLESVSAELVEEAFEEGEYLFKHDETAAKFFILEEGRIRLSVGGLGTVSRTVYKPGDTLGWSSLVGFGSYTATARCLSRTRVLSIQGSRLEELLERDPRDGVVFYRGLARLIRGRLMDSYKTLLSYDPVRKPHSYG